MNKCSKKLVPISIVVVALLIVMGLIYRLVNKTPSESLSDQQKLVQIFEDGGCIDCHSSHPHVPFYGKMPIVGTMINAHIESGYKSFDIDPLMDMLSKGEKVNEIDLAKVERTMLDGTMPIMGYYMIHWGSSITSDKREMALNAIKNIRAKYYPNALAAEEFKNETIRPIPDAVNVDLKKAELGELLYHDTRLSGNNTVSCATCHDLSTAGVDNDVHSEGIGGQEGGINAPTVYNSYFNFVQFWDGRAGTLAQQAAGPPLNPVEMGCKSFAEIVSHFAADKAFVAKFNAVYPEGMSEATITDAIGEFEKTLLTPNCKFDKYLKGDKNAMTADEIKGYALFKKYNCATCHAGELMGGQSYELMGERADYFHDRKALKNDGLTDSDNGRFAQTKNERDRYRFKTPTLRNIALTWPYYHDGSVKTLEDAIKMMGKYQVGANISDDEVAKINSFLNALTGEYKGKVLTNKNKK